MSVAVFRPDHVWFRALAEKMVRLAKVDPNEVLRVDINCGSGSNGVVVMKDGRRIRV